MTSLESESSPGAAGTVVPELVESIVELEDPSRRAVLFGPADRNLRLIRSAFDIRISAREGRIHLNGTPDAVRRAAAVLDTLQTRLRVTPYLDDDAVNAAINEALAKRDGQTALRAAPGSAMRAIKPKTEGQQAYIRAIQENDLTFCLGPAGTGKTYLAVAMAVALLRTEAIRSMVLVRPAVEAGERLGFLPGDMQAKVNPYLRPLFDAIHDLMPIEQVKKYIQNDVIEVVPLAFMRGRTLSQAVIILDEAQNTTVRQMLMFLTRLGHGSKMIVTGDDTQIDLEEPRASGLFDAVRRLNDTGGVGLVRLTEADIVRHPLVQRVVEVYADVLDRSDSPPRRFGGIRRRTRPTR